MPYSLLAWVVGGLLTLDLSCNRLDDDAAEALASSPHLARLVTLNLSWNRLAVKGVVALVTEDEGETWKEMWRIV